MKTVIPKNLLLGLCAYLRQLALSIDRSLGNLADFKAYCETGPTKRLSHVIERLGDFTPQLNRISNDMDKEISSPPLFIRLWSWYFQNGVGVDSVFLMEIRTLLEKIATRLNAPGELNRNDFVEIRLALTNAADHLAHQIFPISKRNMVLNVEHLNQNLILKTNSVETIAGGSNWLFSR